MNFYILCGIIICIAIGLLFVRRKIRKAEKDYNEIIKKMDEIKRSLRYPQRMRR